MKFFNKSSTMAFHRSTRIAQELKKEISIILLKYIRDPRINCMITISMVKLSRDLSFAKIFISLLNINKNCYNNFYQNKNSQEIISILKGASKYIRKMLSYRIKLRKIPFLLFDYDNSLIEGMKISNLLRKL